MITDSEISRLDISESVIRNHGMMETDKFHKRELVVTSDGSSSIFLPELNEHYHSHHGAVQESRHVFIKMGLEVAITEKSKIDILEIGFGTGLNAYLVYYAVDTVACPELHYTTLDAYPIGSSEYLKLNYWKVGGLESEELNKETFYALHEAAWMATTNLFPGFALEKLNVRLEDFIATRKYDLIFFDAFSPRSQPELWTKEVFQKMYDCMKPGGILVTYCAKGEVRRNMQAAGFSVEKLPGPPGKREMLRATVSSSKF